MARKHNPFNFSNIKNFRLVAPTSLTGNKIQLYRTANFSNIHENPAIFFEKNPCNNLLFLKARIRAIPNMSAKQIQNLARQFCRS